MFCFYKKSLLAFIVIQTLDNSTSWQGQGSSKKHTFLVLYKTYFLVIVFYNFYLYKYTYFDIVGMIHNQINTFKTNYKKIEKKMGIEV